MANITRLESREEFKAWARRTFTSRRYDSSVLFFVDAGAATPDSEVLVLSQSCLKGADWDKICDTYPNGGYAGSMYGFPLECAPKVGAVTALPLDVLRKERGIRIIPGVEVAVVPLQEVARLHNCSSHLEEEPPHVTLWGWDIPVLRGTAAKGGAEGVLAGLAVQRRPQERFYYERMGLSPRELFQVTPETVNRGTMRYGNVDYHDSPLGAALCIIDRDLSLKMAKKFLRWGANAANQHPNRNPYAGKMCPMEMAKWAHGQDAAYMAEIVPLLVKNGAEPPKEKTPAAGDCATDGK